MRKKLNIDFAIIMNPLSEKEDFMVFLTRRGSDMLNEDILHTEDYKEACIILSKHNFTQTDVLTFENISGKYISAGEIERKLNKEGMKYSYELEKNLQQELTNLQNEALKAMNENHIEPVVKKKKKITAVIPINKPIEMDETVVLSFYAFIKAILVDDRYIRFDFAGDFFSLKESPDRKFLKIITTKFKRMVGKKGGAEIYLESIDTYKDMMDEMEIFKNLPFDLSKQAKGDFKEEFRDCMFNVLEIRDNINLENKISIHVASQHDYDNMLRFSKKIEEEYRVLTRNPIVVSKVKKDAWTFKSIMQGKIDDAVAIEEYESAAFYKKNLDFIDERIEFLQNIDSEFITPIDYQKRFSVESLKIKETTKLQQ